MGFNRRLSAADVDDGRFRIHETPQKTLGCKTFAVPDDMRVRTVPELCVSGVQRLLLRPLVLYADTHFRYDVGAESRRSGSRSTRRLEIFCGGTRCLCGHRYAPDQKGRQTAILPYAGRHPLFLDSHWCCGDKPRGYDDGHQAPPQRSAVHEADGRADLLRLDRLHFHHDLLRGCYYLRRSRLYRQRHRGQRQHRL